MTDFDAYEDEMGLLFASRDREIERLLAGASPQDEELDELSVFVADVREAYVEPLDEGLEGRHLAAMGAALGAAAAAKRAESRWGDVQMRDRFGRPLAKLAAAAALALAALTGGLAIAGVDIPVLPEQAADQAKEAVAEHAPGPPQDAGPPVDTPPEQARPPEFVTALRAAIEAGTPPEDGCTFGQTIATIASGSDPTEDHDPCAQSENGQNGNQGGNAGQPQGSKSTGVQASGGIAGNPPTTGAGKATGDQASGGISASPPQTASKATGDQASHGVSSGAGPPATTGSGAAAGGQGAAGGGQQVPPVTVPAPAGRP